MQFKAEARKAAEAAAAAEKLRKFVRVGFEGAPASYKQIPRHRLLPSVINRLFSCDVEFFVDDEGVIVQPKDWIVQCAPAPTVYFIKEKAWMMLEMDPMEEDEYRGHTIVVVDDVPPSIMAPALTAWLNFGLDDDDPDLAMAREQLDWLKERLSNIERLIKELPTKKFGSVAGAFGPKEELKVRKKRGELLSMQKKNLMDDITELEGKFSNLRLYRTSLASPTFDLRRVSTKFPLNLATWECRFKESDPRSARASYIACHKKDWSSICLAVHRVTGEPLVGKEEVPKLTDAHELLNMRGVSVSRRKHGLGMYVFPDERAYYSGQWVRGLREGIGTSVGLDGRYQGAWKAGERSGTGTLITSAGDTLRGSFGHPGYHESVSLFGGEEYMDGVPHGRVSASMSDGSTFDGEWWNGVPRGTGRYVGGEGCVIEGSFGDWGCLEGYGAVTRGERTQLGVHVKGLLDGQGVEMDTVVGNYEGEFKRGQRQGYGTLLTPTSILQGACYRGWWKRGLRWGQGTLNYSNLDTTTTAAMEKFELIKRGQRLATVASAEGKPASVIEAIRATGGSSSLEPSEAEIEAAAAAAAEEEGGSSNSASRGDSQQRKGSSTSYSVAMAGDTPEAVGDIARVVYLGDYEVSCGWVGSLPRAGGVFTSRRSRVEPNLHHLAPTISSRPLTAPLGLADWDKLEDSVAKKRVDLERTSGNASRCRRLVKEAQNLKEYGIALRAANALLPEVRARNRASKPGIEEIRKELKRLGYKFDDKGLGLEPGEDAVQMDDKDIMDLLEMQEDAVAIKVLPPSEVKQGYVI